MQSPEYRGELLARVEVRPGKGTDESWLQRIIFDHPEILPIAEFDDVAKDAIKMNNSNKSLYGLR